MKRRKPVLPPPPTIEDVIQQTSGAANRSMLPLRPYARFYADLCRWTVDAVTEASIPYNGLPFSDDPMHHYAVTVMPERYYL